MLYLKKYFQVNKLVSLTNIIASPSMLGKQFNMQRYETRNSEPFKVISIRL